MIFIEGKLYVIEEHTYFIEEDVKISNDKTLYDDIIKAMGNNEAISATDVSVKESHIGGYWKFSDEFDLAENKNIIWSNKWNHNILLAAKSLPVLDLVQIVVSNMKHAEEHNA